MVEFLVGVRGTRWLVDPPRLRPTSPSPCCFFLPDLFFAPFLKQIWFCLWCSGQLNVRKSKFYAFSSHFRWLSSGMGLGMPFKWVTLFRLMAPNAKIHSPPSFHVVVFLSIDTVYGLEKKIEIWNYIQCCHTEQRELLLASPHDAIIQEWW